IFSHPVYLFLRKFSLQDSRGGSLRYRFSCRGDVLKVITHINHLANINDHNGLSQQEIADILKLYPDAFNAA
ncbi:hypothetical protein ACF1T8_003906, partial [Escherichia coli]